MKRLLKNNTKILLLITSISILFLVFVFLIFIDLYYKNLQLIGATFIPGGFYEHKIADADLKELYTSEKLYELTKDCTSDLKKALILMKWAYNRIKFKPIESFKIKNRPNSSDYKTILNHYDNSGFVHCADHHVLLL